MIGEIKRKSIHFLVLAIPLGYYFLPKSTVLLIILPLTIIALIFDLVRLVHIPFWRWLQKFMYDIYRKHEYTKIAGSTYILLGATLTVLLFNKYIAILVLSFTVLADTSAALIGKKWGKHKFLTNKTVEGTMAFLLTSLLIALIVPNLPLDIKLMACCIATIIEAMPSFIDDNITIPLIAGGIIQLLWIGL
ncbi:hypothetical protein JW877_00210 [bacterium]|nr:hypothetical protein [bacterium]